MRQPKVALRLGSVTMACPPTQLVTSLHELVPKSYQSLLFWFQLQENLYGHDGVCLFGTPILYCKHDISRKEPWTSPICYVDVPH